MTITLILAESVSSEMDARLASSPEVDEILAVADRFEASITPTHPQVDDPRLGQFFTVEIGPDVDESEFIDSLRECNGVEAAYIKPADELP